jgi:hypothetical protein
MNGYETLKQFADSIVNLNPEGFRQALDNLSKGLLYIERCKDLLEELARTLMTELSEKAAEEYARDHYSGPGPKIWHGVDDPPNFGGGAVV